jgi:hypothetical protein
MFLSDLREINEDMLGWFDLRSSTTELTFRVDEFVSIQKLGTTIALITLSIREVTERAFSSNKSIGQKSFTFLAILLLNNLFIGVTILMNFIKDILSNHSLFLSWGSTKVIEVTVEPFVDFFVNLVIMVTKLFWSFLFLNSFGFSGSTVFISTTDIDSVVSHQPAVSGKDISWKDTTYDVAKMRNIIDIRESTSNEYISLSLLRMDLLTLVFQS